MHITAAAAPAAPQADDGARQRVTLDDDGHGCLECPRCHAPFHVDDFASDEPLICPDCAGGKLATLGGAA